MALAKAQMKTQTPAQPATPIPEPPKRATEVRGSALPEDVRQTQRWPECATGAIYRLQSIQPLQTAQIPQPEPVYRRIGPTRKDLFRRDRAEPPPSGRAKAQCCVT